MGRGKQIQNLRDARARLGRGLESPSSSTEGQKFGRGPEAPSSVTVGQASREGSAPSCQKQSAEEIKGGEDLPHHGKSNLLKKSSTLSTSSPTDTEDISEDMSFTKTQQIFFRSCAAQTELTMENLDKMFSKIEILNEFNSKIKKIDQVFS